MFDITVMSTKTDPLVRPFRGLRPAPKRAADIAAPPYDVVNVGEAREWAQHKPYSFFHVSRAEIDLPPETDPYSDAVYSAAAAALRRFESDGVLRRDDTAGFYIYQMSGKGRTQTGVAVSASIAAYLDNRIRKHELTRPAKETDRVKQIDAVDAMTGPVLLIHRADARLGALIAAASAREADCIVPDLNGIRHSLWAVFEPELVDGIGRCFNQMRSLYIADGHHRSAAAARIQQARRTANPGHTGAEPYNGFLAVSFPDNEVRILDYNRLVRDLNGRDPGQFLLALEPNFVIASAAKPVRPGVAYSFGMYLAGHWYTLKLRSRLATTDPVEKLDVRVLDGLVLEPLLGISDPRTDPRIDFVGGTRGPEALAARVDSGEMAVGFSLFPTSLDDLMAVADSGSIMPPKSTWFEPKLADGLISLPLD